MLRFSCLLFLCFTSCLANNGLGSMADSQVNVYHMSKLFVGMKQCEVLNVMRQPYSHETFQFDDTIYDVWFYVTKPTVLGQSRMVPQNLTPLTFKNGKLVGWGFAYYNYLIKKEDLKNKPKTIDPNKNLEDEGLEKALQAPPGSRKIPMTPSKPLPQSNKPKKEPKSIHQETPVSDEKEKSHKEKPPLEKKPPKPSMDKIETLKVDPLHDKPVKKLPENTPDKNKIEPQKPPESSKPRPQVPPPKPTTFVSMSSVPKKTDPHPPKQENPPEQKPLLDEDDVDMLDEASDQNFNQS